MKEDDFMQVIKLEDYKTNNYICYIDKYDNIQLVCTDELEEIKKLSNEGITLYGTVKELIFDNPYEHLKNMIEERIDYIGHEDILDNIDYDTVEFKELISSFKKWLDSLESMNDIYYQDENTIIEVKDNVEM